MTALTAFGAAAVTAMLMFYWLEPRSPWFSLCFAVGCAASSAYGWLSGTWPFGVVEGRSQKPLGACRWETGRADCPSERVVNQTLGLGDRPGESSEGKVSAAREGGAHQGGERATGPQHKAKSGAPRRSRPIRAGEIPAAEGLALPFSHNSDAMQRMAGLGRLQRR